MFRVAAPAWTFLEHWRLDLKSKGSTAAILDAEQEEAWFVLVTELITESKMGGFISFGRESQTWSTLSAAVT